MLIDLIAKNRSFRSFDPERKITRKELLGFIEHARLSPSSRNLQPLVFRPVHTVEECNVMLPLTGWAALLEVKLPPVGHSPTGYIIICCDTGIAPNPERCMKDVGITAHSILLAASEAGLGGCMIGSFSPEKVAAAMNIDEKYRPVLVLALGLPDERVEITDAVDKNIDYYREGGIHYVPKRPLEEIVI